jgi:hypothetical protein
MGHFKPATFGYDKIEREGGKHELVTRVIGVEPHPQTIGLSQMAPVTLKNRNLNLM